MSSLRKNFVARFRQSAAFKKKTRGMRAASRQPWLEALEARVVLSGGVFAQELGATVQSWPRASFVDPFDKIVAAGNMNGDVTTFRLTPNGMLDNSFSGDGIVTTDVSKGGTWDWAMAAEPYTYQDANKIVVAGRATYLTPVLLRYNADGSLDNSFGSKGMVKADSGYFADVLVQEDGKILAVGSNGIYRYAATGAVDRSFGGDGIVEVQGRSCMTLQTVGNEHYVVAGGLVAGIHTDDFILSRYRLADGSLDTNFGNGGSIITDFGFSDYMRDLEITSSNELIAVGRGWGGSFGFPIVVRYDINGHEVNKTVTRDVTETNLVTTVDTSADELTSYGRFVNGNVGLYFTQNGGTELWRTDGTASGTAEQIVVTGKPFSSLANLTTENSAFFFTDQNGTTSRLWTSDGTSENTEEITPTVGSTFSSLASLTMMNGALYFVANGGTELWTHRPIVNSQGQPDVETVLIRTDGFSGLASLTNVNGTLYFTNGVSELWKSDGTATGTTRVAENTSFSSLASLTNANGTLYFTDAGFDVWRSDGTQGGTNLALAHYLNLANLTYLNTSALYFTASDSAGQNLYKSWISANGILSDPVKISGVAAHVYGDVVSLVPLECSLYFTTEDSAGKMVLWTTNGEGTFVNGVETPETAVRVADSLYDIQSLADMSGTLLFTAGDADTAGKLGLWKVMRGSGADTAAIQDGKLVIAGGLTEFENKSQIDLFVARYNLDGTVDSTFGQGDGRYIAKVGNFPFLAQDSDGRISVAIQSNGNIVLSGGANGDPMNPGPALFVTRLTADGTLDTTFGNPPPVPTLSIADASVLEGNRGTVNMVFTVTRAGDTSQAVSVSYATVPDTATKDVDYKTTVGTLTIAAGAESSVINVPVIGDRIDENAETFKVTLSNASGGATFVREVAVGTITDNDGPTLLAAFEEAETAPALTPQELRRLTTLAATQWSTGSRWAVPADLQVEIDDLPSGQLGAAFEHTIAVDINANGAGWYTGRSALSAGRVDLLTVLAHEIGHVLGYEHSDTASDLMAATLPLGTRRLPGLGQLEMAPATLEPLTRPMATAARHTTLPGVDSRVKSLQSRTVDKSDFNLLLEPAARGISQPSDGSPQSFEARLLSDVLDEQTELLDDSLLDLLAQAGV